MDKNIEDDHETFSNSYNSYLRDSLLEILDIYEKYSYLVNFWGRKIFLFLNGSEFWNHEQVPSPAPNMQEVKCHDSAQWVPPLI